MVWEQIRVLAKDIEAFAEYALDGNKYFNLINKIIDMQDGKRFNHRMCFYVVEEMKDYMRLSIIFTKNRSNLKRKRKKTVQHNAHPLWVQ